MARKQSMQSLRKALVCSFLTTGVLWSATIAVAAAGLGRAPAHELIPAAGALARSIQVVLSMPGHNMGVAPFEMPGGTGETVAKTRPLFDALKALDLGVDAAASNSEQYSMPVGQAQQIFVGADRVLSQNPWHHFAEEHNALAALQSISQITGEQHGRFTVVNDLAAINDVIANLDGSTVRNSEGAGWARVFDNYRTLVDANHARGTPLPEHAPRIAKNPDPINRKMREFYRAMMRGTLEVLSPTASLGKKAIAPEELSHEDVMTITYANFERTAQIVLRRAPQLSVSLRTVQEINRSLTVGLVDDSIRGKLFHGDAWFHQEVKQFYRFLETPKFRRFMRKFPVEAAHWIHYVISVQDVLPDANSRTSKMMADLILLKAGLAPAYYESMDEFFEQGGPRSSLSVQQRLNYFYRIVSRSLEFVRGEMKVQRPSTSESLKAALLSSPYHEGVAPTPESRRSLVEFMSMVHRAEPRRLQ